MKILTVEECKKAGLMVWLSYQGYGYTKGKTSYLIRNKKLIAKGDSVALFENGDYSYRIKNKRYYMRKNRKMRKIELFWARLRGHHISEMRFQYADEWAGVNAIMQANEQA